MQFWHAVTFINYLGNLNDIDGLSNWTLSIEQIYQINPKGAKRSFIHDITKLSIYVTWSHTVLLKIVQYNMIKYTTTVKNDHEKYLGPILNVFNPNLGM